MDSKRDPPTQGMIHVLVFIFEQPHLGTARQCKSCPVLKALLLLAPAEDSNCLGNQASKQHQLHRVHGWVRRLRQCYEIEIR